LQHCKPYCLPPQKTFIGRIEKGFNFPGYHAGPGGLSMAEMSREKFLIRVVRLSEQDREDPCGSPRLGLAFMWPTLNPL